MGKSLSTIHIRRDDTTVHCGRTIKGNEEDLKKLLHNPKAKLCRNCERSRIKKDKFSWFGIEFKDGKWQTIKPLGTFTVNLITVNDINIQF